ncbi:MAG: hypothetical protein AAFP26_10110 [Planctomycetota bacterium]
MAGIGKNLVRVGVITALVGGAGLVVAGPDRLSAVFHQTRDGINEAIDSTIDDPIALRGQIRKLESEYPKRIAEVRSDLGEVQTQVAQMEREQKVAARVVALASQDLSRLDATITNARATQQANPGAIVRVSFNNAALDLTDAYGRRGQIEQTLELYSNRVGELDVDLEYLRQQEGQLAELLTRLETERSEFQTKIFQLDAQIDAIARNDRMIELMEARQATIERHNRYQAHSLEQLNGRLNSLRSEQRAKLEAIAGRATDRNYIDEAEFLVDREGVVGSTEQPTLFTPPVIEVGPEGGEQPSDQQRSLESAS